MKKILHIINSLDVGGAEYSLIRIINNNKNFNHKIIILRPGIKLLDKYNNNKENILYKYNFTYLNFIFLFLNLLIIIRKYRPDNINCWMYHSAVIGGLASKICGFKKIIWLVRHNDPRGKFLSFNSRISIFLFKLLSYFIPQIIVYNSDTSKKSHKRYGINQTIRNIVINNGYDTAPIKFEKKYEKNNLIIANITRWNKQKNHRLLLRSLEVFSKNYPDIKWKLLLGGRFLNKNNIEILNLIDKYNLKDNIILIDYIEDVSKLFKKIDIYVQTSLDESFPNIVAESMLNYTPVVATNVGDTHIIINKFGWLTNLDKKEISKKIYEAFILKQNKDNWQNLQKKSNKHITTNFSLLNTSKKISTLWE